MTYKIEVLGNGLIGVVFAGSGGKSIPMVLNAKHVISIGHEIESKGIVAVQTSDGKIWEVRHDLGTLAQALSDALEDPNLAMVKKVIADPSQLMESIHKAANGPAPEYEPEEVEMECDRCSCKLNPIGNYYKDLNGTYLCGPCIHPLL